MKGLVYRLSFVATLSLTSLVGFSAPVVAAPPPPPPAPTDQCFPGPGGSVTCVIVQPGSASGTVFQPGIGIVPTATGTVVQTATFSSQSSLSLLQGLGHIAEQTSQIGLTAVQQQIWAIKDRLQSKPAGPPRPIGFAGDVPEDKINSSFGSLDASFSTLDGALGGLVLAYTDPKSPIVTKGALPPPEPSRISYAAWGQGFTDYSKLTASAGTVDVGRNTLTGGGLGGVDMTIQRLTSASDALVLGVLGGFTTSDVHNAGGATAQVNGPSVGAYGVYVNGPFSVDGTFKTDFLDISETSVIPLGLNNYTGAGNFNYKVDLGTWWWEPTAGASYTATVWNGQSRAFSLTDGTDVRVQGGIRFGSGFDWAGIHFSETLALLAYDDVLISGGTLAIATGSPLAPTDQGYVFGQAIGHFEAAFNQYWSAYIEGEFRGTSNLYGVAGRVGVRAVF